MWVLKTSEWNQCLLKTTLPSSHLPSPFFPPCFTWLVKQQSSKKREEKEEMHSFSPSRCLSVCELWFIFNDWFEKK